MCVHVDEAGGQEVAILRVKLIQLKRNKQSVASTLRKHAHRPLDHFLLENTGRRWVASTPGNAHQRLLWSEARRKSSSLFSFLQVLELCQSARLLPTGSSLQMLFFPCLFVCLFVLVTIKQSPSSISNFQELLLCPKYFRGNFLGAYSVSANIYCL